MFFVHHPDIAFGKPLRVNTTLPLTSYWPLPFIFFYCLYLLFAYFCTQKPKQSLLPLDKDSKLSNQMNFCKLLCFLWAPILQRCQWDPHYKHLHRVQTGNLQKKPCSFIEYTYTYIHVAILFCWRTTILLWSKN